MGILKGQADTLTPELVLQSSLYMYNVPQGAGEQDSLPNWVS